VRVKPYYADDLVTIYHGDCREWMPEADVIVTDPPYGIDINPVRSRFDRIVGDAEPFDPAFLLALGKPTVLFGANHYADRLPPSPSWIVWDKRGSTPSNLQADCELAWTNLGGPVRSVRHYWNGGGSKQHETLGGSYHPTQKPVGVMRWIIDRCPDGSVLDPFMGGGSTLMAAKAAGRRAIGIEIEERYCEIAATRCSQEVLGLTA
jgi:site-specific DNA-methyltransferase (adenine-specific)